MSSLLLFSIVVCTVLTSASANSSIRSSGSGDSGSTSQGESEPGSEATSMIPPCHVPAYSNIRRIQKNVTDEVREKLVTEGRCYLTCTTQHYQTNDKVRRKDNPEIPYWPYMTVERGCSTTSSTATTNEVHECTRGCVLNFSLNDPRQCTGGRRSLGTCVMSCIDECNGTSSCINPDLHDPWIHSACTVTCRQSPCSEGCRSSLSADGDLPQDPIGPPIMHHNQNTDRVGQFFVNFSSASPPTNDRTFNQSSIAPVAFLFRIKLMSTHAVSFIWITNPFTPLDLADYACQDVKVSFAVANKIGLSNFSDSVQITIRTEVFIPHPPTNLRISSEIDKRTGFFGHAILNISWDEPQNRNFLDNYSIEISSTSESVVCRAGHDTRNKTVATYTTTITVMAETSGDLPHMGCTYNIQVFAVGVDGKSNSLSKIYTIPDLTTEDIAFQCEQLWDSQDYLFSYNFTWTIPHYLRHGDIITGFWLNFEMQDVTGQTVASVPTFRKKIQFPQDFPEVFSIIITLDDTGDEGRQYYLPQHNQPRIIFIEVTAIWTRNLVYQPAIHTYSCRASTLSPPPSSVQNLNVSSYCFNHSDEIVLEFSWSPPSTFNGVPASYDVCIGPQALEYIEDVAPNLGHSCALESLPLELTNATVTLMFARQSNIQLFFQIRANNEYVSSNWSDPYPISLASDGSRSCNQEESMDTEWISNVSFTISDVTFAEYGEEVPINAWVIVGLSVGGLVLAVVLLCFTCLIFWCIKSSRNRKRLLRITQDHCDDPMFSGPQSQLLRNSTATKLVSPQRDEWEIPANEVIIEDCLGEGAFGEVYKGVIKCPIVNPRVQSSVRNAFCTPVAIKLLKSSAIGNEKQDFLSEIEMMKKVTEGQNPHVVCLVGCVTIQEPLCLITEFVKYGDLLSYLRTNRRMCTGSSTKEDEENDAYIQLGNASPIDLISFAYQIASGMEYLASLGIVHRDLACRNILIDEGKVLKITDFGMSRETDEIYVQKRTGRVPLKWMAIESIIAREFTSASDVWSYGVTLWEIGTLGGFPYPSTQNEDLLSLLKRGHRMEKPDNCSPEVYDIMLMCWNEEPQKRPKFTELRSKFDAMLLAERKDAYIDLHNIDSDKPYYRLDTMATVAANALHLSPNPSDRSSEVSPAGSGNNSRNGSKGCSPQSLHTQLSQSHMSEADCYRFRKQRNESDLLTPSLSLFVHQSPCPESSGRTRTASDAERRGRDRSQEQGRPVSLHLPRDHERRERQNPYVDEPSKAAITSLAPSNGSERRARRGSDSDITELNLRGEQLQSGDIKIMVTDCI